MLERYSIRRAAFYQALDQFDLSTLSSELQTELNAVRQGLENDVTEDTIKQIDAVLKKSDHFDQLYR